MGQPRTAINLSSAVGALELQMSANDSDPFYASVPVFRSFHRLMEPTLYTPLPDDWTLGIADVVGSTKAIQENRYKAVNMAGAAVIAAVKNAIGGGDFPYVFGGDGASFAVPAPFLSLARDALAAVAAWVRDELDLALRIALVPVASVHAQGLDVRVTRFAPSPNVSYAIFSGGGLAWADAAMKRGEFALAPAAPGTRPDLAGLSCRFSPIASARGVILSLLILKTQGADPEAFRAAIEDVIALIENSPGMSTPVPQVGLSMPWPPTGVELEARTARSTWVPLFVRRYAITARTLLYYLILRYEVRVGRFVPAIYLRQVVENSDFRKFDDGLRMVLDCSPDFAATIEDRLLIAQSAGIIRYGLHRQDEALMTCFTPSVTEGNHVHFIDGAGGGYAAAATALKAPRSS
jgi:hypothetical protein